MKDCTDKSACDHMGRREFLVKAGLVAGGVVLTVSSLKSTTFASAIEDVKVAVAADSPLAKVGGSQIIDTPAGKVIVIRTDKSSYAAFSARCTHKGARLNYNAESKQLECPSHGSKFSSTDGKVTAGPAENPLASYATKGNDEGVTVTVGS